MYLKEPVRAADMIDAVPVELKDFKCPVCAEAFLSYTELRDHYIAAHDAYSAPVIVALNLNGRLCDLLVEPHWTLQRALQFRLGLTGTKHMCDRGACGSCTVIMDNRAILACTTLAIECRGKIIQTIEGIAADPKWRPLIDAYCRWDAMQCGYCTPGFLVTAKAMLDKNPNPTEEECRAALAGNICICGTYPRHATAILEAVMNMANGGETNG